MGNSGADSPISGKAMKETEREGQGRHTCAAAYMSGVLESGLCNAEVYISAERLPVIRYVVDGTG